MSRINWGRVIVGGLAAGVVMNLGEWLLHEVILRERMESAAAAMGLERPTGSDIGIFVAMTFALGILLVWLYAAIRPRYGPGPKAADRRGTLRLGAPVRVLCTSTTSRGRSSRRIWWGSRRSGGSSSCRSRRWSGGWLYREGVGGRGDAVRLAALLLVGICGLACSTGDPDTEPADAGRIQRTTARVDSQLNQAREHIRTIDTLGAGSE